MHSSKISTHAGRPADFHILDQVTFSFELSIYKTFAHVI